ncbi:hypothetical protein BD626DRAFT_503488 [Schizophyllum amplum]|uniref:Uncharacterized protein n=1 Tax=Schizophyllum amplum TaxID=97359 RepID=A0A550C872_9AGAR|nr:hypothetical protein BD626DRAFT_503488 [Auriculariopsis ampla]
MTRSSDALTRPVSQQKLSRLSQRVARALGGTCELSRKMEVALAVYSPNSEYSSFMLSI